MEVSLKSSRIRFNYRKLEIHKNIENGKNI